MLGFLLWSSHGSNFRYFLKRYIGALGPQIVCPDVLCDLEQPRRKRSEEHTSELQSQSNLVCRLLLEKKKNHLYVHLNRPHLSFSMPLTSLPGHTVALAAHHTPHLRAGVSLLLSAYPTVLLAVALCVH